MRHEISTALQEIKGKLEDNGTMVGFTVEKYLSAEYCGQPTISKYSKEPCNKFLHMHKM